jgi:hypothetical protein
MTAHLLSPQRRDNDRKSVNAALDGLRPGPVDSTTTAWLAGLLPSPHVDAVTRLADALLDSALVPDAELAVLDADAVIDRIEHAIDRRKSPVLIESLLGVLIRLDGLRALTAAQAEGVFQLNRMRLPTDLATVEGPDDNRSAAVRQAARLVGSLMARRLDNDRTWELYSEMLSGLDLDRLGGKLKSRSRPRSSAWPTATRTRSAGWRGFSAKAG